MDKPRGRVENLRPARTKEVAQARGKLGGIKSGEAKREKKLLSQMYAEIIAKGFMVDGQRISLDQVTSSIMARGDSASVSMLKEMREATEGNKVKVEGGIAVSITPLDESL